MAAVAARFESAHDRPRPVPNDRLEIRSDPVKGRGVFARAPIAAGALIEACPVVVVPPEERRFLDRTVLHDYYFVWYGDSDEPSSSAAVALGLLALCNHSRRPRAWVRRNHARFTLDLIALAAIAAGDEVTIDYHCPLWFVPEA